MVITNNDKKVQETNKKEKFKQQLQNLIRNLKITFDNFFFSFKSDNFTARFLQIASIFIVQRYPSFFSLYIILWIIFCGFTIQSKWVKISSLFISVPGIILNYVMLIWNYVFISKDQDFKSHLWIDIIALNIILMLFLYFSKGVLFQNPQQQASVFGEYNNKLDYNGEDDDKNQDEDQKVSYWQIFQAFFLKNAYLFSLFMIYWIGFYDINFIHLGFTAIFLIFFANNSTYIKNNKQKNQQIQESFLVKKIKFGRKYWIFVVIYVDIYIILKYFIYLIIDKLDRDTIQLLNMIGLVCDYEFSIHFGLTKDDFANISIIWMLFLFVIFQYNSYKSSIYLKYSSRIVQLFAKKKLIQQLFPNFLQLIQTYFLIYIQKNQKLKKRLHMFFYTLLVWLSFIIIMCFLILDEFSLINLYLITFIISLIIYYVIKSTNFQLNYVFYSRLWYFFTTVKNKKNKKQKKQKKSLIIVQFIRYFFQLTGLEYIKNHIINQENEYFKLFQKYRVLYGLFEDFKNKNLRSKFISDIIILLFSVLSQDYFRIVTEGYKLNKKKENQIQTSQQQTTNSRRPFQQLKNHKILRSIINLISKFFTDFLCLIVLIFAVQFKISISMLLFLLIYMLFYHKTHSAALQHIENNKLYDKISKRMIYYKSMFMNINSDVQQQRIDNILNTAQKENKELHQQINSFEFVNLQTKVIIKNKVWIYSFVGSIVCIAITYLSSSLLTNVANENFPNASLWIQWVLFIFGLQITEFNDVNNTFRNIYFYVLIFWLNIADLKCLNFLEEKLLNKDQNEGTEFLELQQIDKQKENIKFINEYNFVISNDFNQILNDMNFNYFQLKQEKKQRLKPVNEAKKTTLTATHVCIYQIQIQKESIFLFFQENEIKINILKYYKTKQSYITMRFMFSTLFLIQKYLFQFYYLILMNIQIFLVGFIFLLLHTFGLALKNLQLQKYFQNKIKVILKKVKTLNTWSIYLVIIQYLFLLMNLNDNTSLIKIPEKLQKLSGMSIINIYINNYKLENYLAFSSIGGSVFILNATIIFLIEAYFNYFIQIAQFIIKKVNKRMIKQKKQEFVYYKIFINYKKWKNVIYQMHQSIYEGILVNFHLLTLIICLFICCSSFHVFNLIMFMVCLGYFLYFEFFIDWPLSLEQRESILYFFKILRIYTFIILIIFTILKIPYIDDYFLIKAKVEDFNYINKYIYFIRNQVMLFKISEIIFMLFFIQIVFDMLYSSDYEELLPVYSKKQIFKSKLICKCIAYRFNNQKFKAIEQNLQNVKQKVNNYKQKIKNRIQNQQKCTINEQSIQKQQVLQKQKQRNAAIFQEQITLFDTGINNKQEENIKKISFTRNIWLTLITFFKKYNNDFLFQDELNLMNFIIQNNPYLVECIKIDINSLIQNDFENLEVVLSFLDQLFDKIYNQIRLNSSTEVLKGPKLKKYLQMQTAKSPQLYLLFQIIQNNNSMSEEDIAQYKQSSKIYQNLEGIKLQDERFDFFNVNKQKNQNKIKIKQIFQQK
ncbi:hypothetical protein IMG5_058970 [Ichthyophthirius multifiliis]|uniref:Uncharacterized protein n=1 Tax=Ichthyophthirius multifiliis TaxID=5932 RepID=G0QNI7_ICHMU|nr:hypothetical protein IMG5_058970 [Ichthyophthirius multifiliis]EGR33221.1 hypothetical protein IMG5_058970 [Ichthyophthirius multifiliis]|eukprot:XP_004037207.1 hypothetical protein IMG5_058970 [Ichthyophthirius multifiliis]